MARRRLPLRAQSGGRDGDQETRLGRLSRDREQSQQRGWNQGI